MSPSRGGLNPPKSPFPRGIPRAAALWTPAFAERVTNERWDRGLCGEAAEYSGRESPLRWRNPSRISIAGCDGLWLTSCFALSRLGKCTSWLRARIGATFVLLLVKGQGMSWLRARVGATFVLLLVKGQGMSWLRARVGATFVLLLVK
ncbi:hypothetical protein [Cohnella mopanensis]|uniref:hypothetical protein n=1 Tax=Cohnella mopanensis TaxID=2911966 RepID=UPI001EF930D0|nr:hypothetical protein [Cohnella mopanensis]